MEGIVAWIERNTMKLGLVGFPQVGKRTFFRLLTQLPHFVDRNALFMWVSVFFSHYVSSRAKT